MKLNFNFEPQEDIIYGVRVEAFAKDKKYEIPVTSYKLGNDEVLVRRIKNRIGNFDRIEVYKI